MGARPEHIQLVEAGQGAVQGQVDVLEYLGADTFVIMSCGDAGQVTVRLSGDSTLKPGDALGLHFPSEHVHFFDAEGLAIKKG